MLDGGLNQGCIKHPLLFHHLTVHLIHRIFYVATTEVKKSMNNPFLEDVVDIHQHLSQPCIGAKVLAPTAFYIQNPPAKDMHHTQYVGRTEIPNLSQYLNENIQLPMCHHIQAILLDQAGIELHRKTSEEPRRL